MKYILEIVLFVPSDRIEESTRRTTDLNNRLKCVSMSDWDDNERVSDDERTCVDKMRTRIRR